MIVFIYKIKKWLKYWILRHFIRNSILYIKIYFLFLFYKLARAGNKLVRIDKWYPSSKSAAVAENSKRS